MADDIVERLRTSVCWCNEFDGKCSACEAADEIQRLTEWRKNALLALDKREAEIGRLSRRNGMLIDTLKEARKCIVNCARQGTGTDPDLPEWEDYCMSVWEAVPRYLEDIDTTLGVVEEARRG